MICKKYKIKLIEDAAEVIGLKYKKKMCGSFGDISTFSFYANKHITTGEGGMILSDEIKIYQKCASLKTCVLGQKTNVSCIQILDGIIDLQIFKLH